MSRAGLLLLATALAACQFPGFEGPQPAAMAVPVPPPKPSEPDVRGIWMVGSRAAEPRLKAVSASYEGTRDTRPHLDGMGTAAGFRSLCGGVGLEHPDMALSDRPIGAAELARCTGRGIMLSEYALGPRQYVYVKDSHVMAVPGVREFVGSWGLSGTRPSPPPAAS